MIEVKPDDVAVARVGAPSFTVTTDRARCVVELAVDPVLFGTLRSRRDQRPASANFVASPELAREAATPLRWEAELPRPLRRVPTLYYRGLAYDTPGVGVESSVADDDLDRAPFVYVDPRAARRALDPHPIPKLPRLKVAGNRLVGPDGGAVVLRGVNRPGMDTATPGTPDFTGTPRDSAASAAGVNAADADEIVRHWKAGVVRLALNQEWVLARFDYLDDVDTAVALAAERGAYTILALRRLRYDEAKPDAYPPLPDENTVRAWRLLARRYRLEPAVLFDVFERPHAPAAGESFVFERPASDAVWSGIWRDWALRLDGAVRREAPDAVVFVAGWNGGLDLRGYPLAAPAGGPLPQAVYAAHVERKTAKSAGDFERSFGIPSLRAEHPVFVAEWGGTSAKADLTWGAQLEGYMRERHAAGIVGWTASSWPEPPPLIELTVHKKTAAKPAWKEPVRLPDGTLEPTAFGALVQAALAAPVELPAPAAGAADRTLLPVLPPLPLTASVGAGGTNRAADVHAVQARLAQLRYLADADLQREQQPGAALTATIAAIKALQRDFGLTADGLVKRASAANAALERAIPIPTADDYRDVGLARATIGVGRSTALPLSKPVGKLAPGVAGNHPDDLAAVQAKLVALGRLGAGADLPKTIDAITSFQTAVDIAWWVNWGKKFHETFGTGTSTTGVVAPGDATHVILDRYRSYSLAVPGGGPPITARNFVRSAVTGTWQGISYSGSTSPELLPDAVYEAIGLGPALRNALKFVSSHEGSFDGLNTFDVALTSFGLIQFAGGAGRGLGPMLSLLKCFKPTVFDARFRRFGIDVEYNAVAGAPDRQIANARIVVLDPDARQVLRGRSAETAVARDPRLWAVFVAAGRDPEVQEIEAEAAARLYVLNSLRARVKGSTTTFGQILKSEQGVAVLVDRSVQEGAGEGAAGTSRVGGAARTVAARHGVAQLTDDRFEREVIVQVADDVRADIELIRAIPAAVSALKTVRDSAQQGHPVHQSDLDPIKTRVDALLAIARRKSDLAGVGGWTTDPAPLLTKLPQVAAALDATKVPAQPAQAAAYLGTQMATLTSLTPATAAANLNDVLARLDGQARGILRSALVGPP